MLYNYAQLEDETQIAYSELEDDMTIRIVVERPRDFGFDSAECRMPICAWSSVDGFTTAELEHLTTFLRNNAPLITRYAKQAGKTYA